MIRRLAKQLRELAEPPRRPEGRRPAKRRAGRPAAQPCWPEPPEAGDQCWPEPPRNDGCWPAP